ncbi:hypothetical protein NPIL_623311 [Nephila pilipes]|uniref:Uncharacterized protein n=1 Tax=Nephila pilipes TaxID=299642 RepID=A0A8X6U2S1_NEPPI|nr:hypothetical protein NPIL_623311 [Nephila pilipes]
MDSGNQGIHAIENHWVPWPANVGSGNQGETNEVQTVYKPGFGATARRKRPPEPILIQKLRIGFADFPYLHCSSD